MMTVKQNFKRSSKTLALCLSYLGLILCFLGIPSENLLAMPRFFSGNHNRCNDFPSYKDFQTFQFLEVPQAQRPGAIHTNKMYGRVTDRYLGITAYSNGIYGDGHSSNYQCTEFAERFVRSIYDIPSRVGIGLGNGQDVAQNIAKQFGNTIGRFRLNPLVRIKLIYFDPACAKSLPRPGALISFRFPTIGEIGHVAIVKRVESDDPTHARIYLAEQIGEKPHEEIGEEHCTWHLNFKKTEQNLWLFDASDYDDEDCKQVASTGAELEPAGWIQPIVVP